MGDYEVRGGPRRGIASATVGFFVGFAGVVLFGPVAGEFGTAMDLSGLELGVLVAAPQLFGSLLRIPFGARVETAGAKRPFLVLLGLSVVGMGGLAALLLAFYPDGLSRGLFPHLFLFGALSGCGVAVFSVGSAQTSYWSPSDGQGTALAVFAGLGNSSPGVSALLLPIALTALGLTGAYLAWLGLLVIGTIAYAALAVDPPYFQLLRAGCSPAAARERARRHGQELFPSGDAASSLRTAAAVPRTWALVALFFTSFGGFLALTVWLPSYWTELHGVDVRTAGVATALAFTLPAALLRIPGGVASDRFGGEATAVGSFALTGVAAAVLVASRAYVPSLAATVLLAAGTGVANAAVFQLVPKYVPEAVGGASGLVGGLGAFGGFVLPPVLGAFVDLRGTSGYATGFVVFVALAAASALVAGALSSGRIAPVEEGAPAGAD